MARGRFLSDSVAKDLKLNSLSVEAELVYLLTIPHLDRDGLIEGDTDVLYGTVCPKRRQFIDRIGEFIQEWVHVGLVACYDSDNGPVLWFKGFAKNQLGIRYDRETPSKFPPPPLLTPVDSIPPLSDILPEASDNCSPHVRAGARPEFQVKVKDQDQSSSPLPPSQPPKADDDDEKVKGDRAVFKAWAENIPGMMTPILADNLHELIDECGAPAVLHGIAASVGAGVRTLNYIAPCARNHAAGKPPPGKKADGTKPNDTEKSALLTRAKNAQASIRTAQQFHGHVDPRWQQDIEAAKGLGLL